MMKRPLLAIAPLLLALVGLFASGCGASSPPPPSPDAAGEPSTATERQPSDSTEPAAAALITAVETTPQNGDDYTFAVTIRSPDTGCDQYADWWEVVSEDGELLYRRILAHSHVDEQPFERSGGPVAIAPNQAVIVRAHMHPQGYGTQAMQGSPEAGFQDITLPEDFATELAEADPQPQDCTF